MIKSIEQATTSLGDLGLNLEEVLTGERVEFDPEKKVFPRKVDYIQHAFAVKIVDAYATDLLAAYRTIESLEAQLEANGVELKDTAKAAEEAAGQVRQVLAADAQFAEAEKMLSKFEQQLELLAQDKRVGKETIAQLQKQVSELMDLRDTVPQLEADVNNVLENLRSYFAEEGIEMIDDDYDDYTEGY